MSTSEPGTDHAKDIRDTLHRYLLQPIPTSTPDVWEIDAKQITRIIDHADALADELAAERAKVTGLEADLKDAEDRGERFFEALKRALPGHHDHVLWFHYTVTRDSVYRKFQEWCNSPKNKIGPLDMEHWFRTFGLQDGDWTTQEGEES